jgi:signal transduction histidine kinase
MGKSRPGVELGSRSMPALRERGMGIGLQIMAAVVLFFLFISAAGSFAGEAMIQMMVDETAWMLDRQGVPGDVDQLRASLEASIRGGRTGTWALMGGVFVVGLLGLTWFVQIRVSAPLRAIVGEVRDLSAGDLERRLDVDRSDEIGDLAQQFNFLATELEGYRDRVQQHARSLEKGVEVRTNALAQRNVELNKAYREKERAFDELKSTQMHLVQQERMATLGQLLAGIAHEINNPVNYMVNAIRPLQANVGRIDELLREHEDALLMAVDEEDSMSPRPDLAQVMADIQQSVDLIRAGADRTARIVQNLRSFSRTSEGDLTQMDLVQGIDVTLSLLNHLIKGRIDVVREFEDVGRIECVQGEVNQIFMNLLSNAAQAIKGSGTIWVRLRAVDNGVEVSVQDDGCGIPRENLARVFEPFFTTKEQPVGTGLGLSISQNLISKHGGEITVASQEGKGTEFVVWLPREQASSEDVA